MTHFLWDPRRPGFFYANAVLGVTMLVIIVWSRKLGKKYFTFCSDVREQSSLFVVSCVQHILSQVDVRSYTHLHWWSDIGPHFLSTRWLGFWLVHLVREYKTNCHMRFFPAGHGKGPCDGHVARVKKWKRTAAKKTVIASVKTYVTVMSDRATALKKNVPSTPDYIFVDWTPPEKNLLPDVVLSTEEFKKCGMGVRSTHCWSSRWKTWGVEISKHPVPNSPSSKSLMGPELVHNDEGDDAGGGTGSTWKRYYRINKPEKIQLNPSSLLRTWRLEKAALEKQNIELARRRQTVKARRLAWLRARGNSRKACAERRAAEKKLHCSSSESSSKSSSESRQA